MSRQGIDRCPHCNARWVDGCANADRCNALDAEDLRAQIEQQAETIRDQSTTIFGLSRCVEHMERRINELLAELEGRAKGTEQ